MTEHQYCALTSVGGEAFSLIPHNGPQGPYWASGPKFLNTPKVWLIDHYYGAQGPPWAPGPKFMNTPDGT